MLAHACGISIAELAGKRQFEGELINLVRAGCSLQALAQDAPYNIEVLKSEMALLSAEVYARSSLPHLSVPVPITHQQDFSGGCYRSLGAGPELDARSTPAASVQPNANAPAEPAAPAEPTDPAEPTESDKEPFMQTVLTALDTIENPEAVAAAKLTLPNLQASCLFANNTFPNAKGGDVKAPGDDSYEARADFNSSSDAIINLLTSYGQSIETTRFTVFGVFASWEKDALVALMSGARDPSKLLLEVATTLLPLQA